MRRPLAWLCAFAFAALGCDDGAPVRLVSGNFLLQAVSSDQHWVAALAGAKASDGGGPVGRLYVVAADTGKALLVDGQASGATFARGHTLYFLGGAHTVAEGTAMTPHDYGALGVWLPGFTSAVTIGAVVRDFATALDGSVAVYLDLTSAAPDAAGTLRHFNAATCAAGKCEPTLLAGNVTSANLAVRVANDGAHALVTLRGATATAPGQVLLVTRRSGGADTRVLSTGADARAAMMTPDGSTVAWVEGVDTLRVASSADPLVPITLSTEGVPIEGAVMLGAHDFVVKLRATATAPVMLMRLSTTTERTALPVSDPGELITSPIPGNGSARYLLYTLPSALPMSTVDDPPDLWLLDLTHTPLTPVHLGMGVATPLAASLAFSDDNSAVRFLANYDPAARLGDEYLARLPAASAAWAAASLRAAAFASGSTKLIYISGPQPRSDAGALEITPDPGKPTRVAALDVVNFVLSHKAPERIYYSQRSDSATDAGIWYLPQP